MAAPVSLRAARALRELVELTRRRPDIGAAIDAAAEVEAMAEKESIDLDLLTVKEAAALLRISPITLREWLVAGKVPAYHAGRRVLLRRVDVAALVKPGLPGAPGSPGGGDDA